MSVARRVPAATRARAVAPVATVVAASVRLLGGDTLVAIGIFVFLLVLLGNALARCDNCGHPIRLRYGPYGLWHYYGRPARCCSVCGTPTTESFCRHRPFVDRGIAISSLMIAGLGAGAGIAWAWSSPLWLFFVPSVVAVPVLVCGTTARCPRCHEPVYWPRNQWDGSGNRHSTWSPPQWHRCARCGLEFGAATGTDGQAAIPYDPLPPHTGDGTLPRRSHRA